jgi:signal transduction histidine kinase
MQRFPTFTPRIALRAEPEKRLELVAHELRNRLGAITAAVEVLNFADAGGELAAEARAVIGRQTRLLALMLDDLGIAQHEPAAHSPAPQQIVVVEAARAWLEDAWDTH